MTIVFMLIPITIAMGLIGLAGFWWSVRDGQYDDPVGDAARILSDEDDHPA